MNSLDDAIRGLVGFRGLLQPKSTLGHMMYAHFQEQRVAYAWANISNALEDSAPVSLSID